MRPVRNFAACAAAALLVSQLGFIEVHLSGGTSTSSRLTYVWEGGLRIVTYGVKRQNKSLLKGPLPPSPDFSLEGPLLARELCLCPATCISIVPCGAASRPEAGLPFNPMGPLIFLLISSTDCRWDPSSLANYSGGS